MNSQALNQINAIGALQNALTELCKYMPNGNVTAGIEIRKYTHRDDFTVRFELSSDAGIGKSNWVFAESTAAQDLSLAINKLLKKAGITTVEQYIRIKAYNQAKGGAA